MLRLPSRDETGRMRRKELDEMKIGEKLPSMKQMKEKLKEIRWNRLMKITVAIACVCLVWSLARTLNSASVVMDLHFQEVAQGKNPDRSRFAASEILSDEVLDAAAQKLGGRVDAQMLRRHLTLTDLTSAASLERVNSAVYNGVENYKEYPVQYRLSCHVVSPVASQNGLGSILTALWDQLWLPGKGKVLRAVAESHDAYFRANHLQSDAVFAVDWTALDGMDHFNRVQAVELMTQRALRLLGEACAAESEFVSEQTGTSFSDLDYLMGRIAAVDTNAYKAYVLDKGLTVDREILLQQLRNSRDNKQGEYERQSATYDVCMQAISAYDPDTTRVVFIPSLDTEDSFYMSRTKVGMDLLVERANKAKTAADQAKHDALYYAYLLECFDVARDPAREQLRRGEELYEAVKTKLTPLFEQAGQLMAERQEQDMQYVDYSSVDHGLHPVSVAVGCVKPFVFLSLCAYLAVCAWQAFDAKRKTREEEEAHVGQ